MDAALVARHAPAHVVVRLTIERVGFASDAPTRAQLALRDAAASGELYVVVTHIPTEREYPVEVSWAHLVTDASAASAAKSCHSHPLKSRQLPCALHHVFAIPTEAAEVAGPQFAVSLVRHRSNARIVLAECFGNEPALDFRNVSVRRSNTSADIRLMDAKALRKDAATASCWCTVAITAHSVIAAASAPSPPPIATATRRAKISQTFAFGVSPALPKSERDAALTAIRSDPDALAAARGVLGEVVSVDVGACEPSTSGCWCSFPVFGADSAATSAALDAMRATSSLPSPKQDAGGVRAAASVFGSMLIANLSTTPAGADATTTRVFEATVTSQPQLLPAALGSAVAVRQGMFLRDEFEEWLARQPGSSTSDDDDENGSEPPRRIVCRVAAAGAMSLGGTRATEEVPTRPSLNAQLQTLFRERFRWIKAHKSDDRATLDAADTLAQQLVCSVAFTVRWNDGPVAPPPQMSTTANAGISREEQFAVADARCVLLTRNAVMRTRERNAEAKAAGAVNGAASASLPRSVSVLASHKSIVGRFTGVDAGAFTASLEQASLPRMVEGNNGSPVGSVADVPPTIVHYLCTFAAFGSVMGTTGTGNVDNRLGSLQLEIDAATAALQPASPPGWSTASGGANAGVNFGLSSDEHLLFWASASAVRTLTEASRTLQGLCYLGAIANATLRSVILGPVMLGLLWFSCLHPAAGLPAFAAGLGVVACSVFVQFTRRIDMTSATAAPDDTRIDVAEWQNNCSDELQDVATARSIGALVAASGALQATAGAVGPSVGTPAVMLGRIVVAASFAVAATLLFDAGVVGAAEGDTTSLGVAIALAATALLLPLPQPPRRTADTLAPRFV